MTLFLHIIANDVYEICTYALSFYGSKTILDRPNQFGWVPIVLGGPNLFWSGSNHFGQIQIIEISPEKSN